MTKKFEWVFLAFRGNAKDWPSKLTEIHEEKLKL